jgi:hypothetical protein
LCGHETELPHRISFCSDLAEPAPFEDRCRFLLTAESRFTDGAKEPALVSKIR